MKIGTLLPVALCAGVAILALNGCGDGWTLDYGKPAAQFEEAAVLAKAGPFIGQKITVKGVVARHDLSDPESAKLYLESGVCCDFGDLGAMAKSYEVGETVFIDGILRRCDEAGVVLSPAIGRDPAAPFDAMR